MPSDRITEALRASDDGMPEDQQLDDQADGTKQSGYVTPDIGPFECENCVHFEAPGTCDEPRVVNDPEVNGKVEAKACCNFFKSAHNVTQEDGGENGR